MFVWKVSLHANINCGVSVAVKLGLPCLLGTWMKPHEHCFCMFECCAERKVARSKWMKFQFG